MKLLSTATLLLALAGCAATGPGIDSGQLAALQKGKTTYGDVVRQFGTPSINSTNMDGTRTAAYLQPGENEPGKVIALIVAINGNPTPNVDSVVFEFDTGGVLTDYRITHSNPKAAAAQPARAVTGTPLPETAQSTAAASATPAQPNTVSAAPRPAPTKKRDDELPRWLPPSSTYDPRDPFK